MSSNLPAAYYETVFILQDPPDPLPYAFAIVTAFNPMDEDSSQDANEAADQSLKALLDREAFRVIGGSPDMEHSEPGWAFSAPFSEALMIARKFRQLAFWWIEEDELHLVDCEDPKPILIDGFSKRIISA